MCVRNLIILAVVFGIVGLVVGYLIFGRMEVTNQLIPLRDLFGGGDTLIGQIADEFRAAKRQNIYISGAVGVGVGVVLSVLLGRRRRR
jgi:hypothetical protein